MKQMFQDRRSVIEVSVKSAKAQINSNFIFLRQAVFDIRDEWTFRFCIYIYITLIVISYFGDHAKPIRIYEFTFHFCKDFLSLIKNN